MGAVSAMIRAIGAGSACAGSTPLVMRRWPVFDWRLRPVPATYQRAEGCQSSLGYEHYDARLCCLGPSPVAMLTSANLWREVVSGRPRLPRLSLSRSVRFTNRFTGSVVDRRLTASSGTLHRTDTRPLLRGIGTSTWPLTALTGGPVRIRLRSGAASGPAERGERYDQRTDREYSAGAISDN
jgi:hypothetical protein